METMKTSLIKNLSKKNPVGQNLTKEKRVETPWLRGSWMAAIFMAAWLSQCMVIGVLVSMPRSLRIPLIHTNSFDSFHIALYSALALEHDNIFCFLLF